MVLKLEDKRMAVCMCTRGLCVSHVQCVFLGRKLCSVGIRFKQCVHVCVYFVLLRILEIFFTLGREPQGEMRGVMEGCEVIQQMLHLFII